MFSHSPDSTPVLRPENSGEDTSGGSKLVREEKEI